MPDQLIEEFGEDADLKTIKKNFVCAQCDHRGAQVILSYVGYTGFRDRFKNLKRI